MTRTTGTEGRIEARRLAAAGLALCLAAGAAACGDNTESSRDGDLDVSGASARVGALLYDEWWTVLGVAAPTETFPLYLQTTGTRDGAITWRCKECHGWDYRGVDGAYGNPANGHRTGVPGLIARIANRTRQELFDVIRDGLAPASGGSAVTAEHAFAAVLGDDEINALVRFLTQGLVDTVPADAAPLIDPVTGIANGDAAVGAALFEDQQAGPCTLCHGPDGTALATSEDGDLGGALGAVARTDPWRTLHRIRWGEPAAAMPAAAGAGTDVAGQVALVAYAQTLPLALSSASAEPVANASLP